MEKELVEVLQSINEKLGLFLEEFKSFHDTYAMANEICLHHGREEEKEEEVEEWTCPKCHITQRKYEGEGCQHCFD